VRVFVICRQVKEGIHLFQVKIPALAKVSGPDNTGIGGLTGMRQRLAAKIKTVLAEIRYLLLSDPPVEFLPDTDTGYIRQDIHRIALLFRP